MGAFGSNHKCTCGQRLPDGWCEHCDPDVGDATCYGRFNPFGLILEMPMPLNQQPLLEQQQNGANPLFGQELICSLKNGQAPPPNVPVHAIREQHFQPQPSKYKIYFPYYE
jgi:hypothetical protein